MNSRYNRKLYNTTWLSKMGNLNYLVYLSLPWKGARQRLPALAGKLQTRTGALKVPPKKSFWGLLTEDDSKGF